MSFSLTTPEAKLFIGDTATAIASVGPNSDVPLPQALHEEILHWGIVNTRESHVPWREEKHILLALSTDSSDFTWGSVFIYQMAI